MVLWQPPSASPQPGADMGRSVDEQRNFRKTQSLYVCMFRDGTAMGMRKVVKTAQQPLFSTLVPPGILEGVSGLFTTVVLP